MKNIVITVLLALLTVLPLGAQSLVEEAYVDMRSGFRQTVVEKGNPDSGWNGAFHVDYLNIHLKGTVAPNVTYTFRHRLSKPVWSEKNLLNATDFAWLTWQATPKFSLTAGKHPVWFGSFEFDADPIDVFYWSKSIADLYQYYTFGVTGTYEVAPSQNLSLQFSQSPLSDGWNNSFAYSLYWNGRIAPWWETTWSLNFIDTELEGSTMNYAILGNRFTAGNVVVEADFINKTSLRGQKRPFFSDGAAIINAKYRMEKVNLCLKGTWDWNWEGNFDLGGDFDVVVPCGSDIKQIAAGAEIFPFGTKYIRLHAFYNYTTAVKYAHSLDLGITWRFDLYKRK